MGNMNPFGGGGSVDTSAQDRAMAREAERDADLKKQEEARKRAARARASGRGLLLYGTEAGVTGGGKSSTLGG